MNRTDLKNYITLCKRQDFDLINNISQDINVKYDVTILAQKYNVSTEEIIGLANIMKIQNDSNVLSDIYNTYYDYKIGGNKFSKAFQNIGKNFSKGLKNASKSVSESVKKTAKKAANEAKTTVSNTVKNESEKLSNTLHENINNLSNNNKTNNINEIKDIKKRLNKIENDMKQIINDINEIKNSFADTASGDGQTGGTQINCACCDCAKDGYIFTDEENNQKCVS